MPGLEAAVASHKLPVSGKIPLTVVLDGKPHALQMGPDQRVPDVALAAGLDLPYSCNKASAAPAVSKSWKAVCIWTRISG